MNKFGFVRVCASSPEVKPANIPFNVDKIKYNINLALENQAELILFPELSITGYTCGDLFYQTNLIDKAKSALLDIVEYSTNKDITIVVGVPLIFKSSLYNCAALIRNGKIHGIVPKIHIPNYNEFYEKRWFASASNLPVDATISISGKNIPLTYNQIFNINGIKIGIEICEDLWVPIPPSSKLAIEGADIILNLSASDELTGKHSYLKSLIKNQSARCRCAYVYSSAGLGESSTDLAFSGNCIIAENGVILKESKRFTYDNKIEFADVDVELLRNDRLKFSTFSEDLSNDYILHTLVNDEKHITDDNNIISDLQRYVSPVPFTDGSSDSVNERCDEISNIQAWGLAQRLRAIGCKHAVIGISGGLDSTLALLVTSVAFDKLNIDRTGIIAVTMPGFGTTSRTKSNAKKLVELIGANLLEIPIGASVKQHFEDIKQPENKFDATYENSQARERTQILMDIANKYGGIVVGTGDLSELALGWCTYNGDHMSMYGVNASVPKTLVKFLVKHHADASNNDEVKRVLYDIIDTPISPELLPASVSDEILQKTEDLVGPYMLHDFFLYNMIRNNFSPEKIYYLALYSFNGKFDPQTIKYWLKKFYQRFFSQQFKRSCMPDGVKVGSVCLSPRGDWRMPSDASATIWIEEVENL